jgi:hypothetical protein
MEPEKMKLILRREVSLTPRSKNARTSEAEANAHFVKCFAERKALIAAIAAGQPHDDEDNHIDTYCHFDLEGYAEPCDEYGRLIGMGTTDD